MEKTIQVLNELERERLIAKYAIGGAIAATFYVEPVATYDLDVFVALPPSAGPLVTLAPIYEFLRQRGYEAEKEHVPIEGVPVRFLPAYNALVEEALHNARETSFGETMTRVVRAEHLLAIMLQTGRPKDKTRMVQMLEEAELDDDYLTEILMRHGLYHAWQEFKGRFDGQ